MKINKNDINSIISSYTSGYSLNEIAKEMKCSHSTIRRCLLKNSVKLRPKGIYKHIISKEEEKQIIDFYINKKRGIQYISNIIGIHWELVKEVLDKNNIPLWTRSELAKANENFYGRSKDFTFGGHKHKKSSRNKISKSLKGNANRIVTGSKSQFILTILGKVQGSYEVAYLQDLIKKGIDLPKLCGKIQTPYGLYFPDFEYDDKFVEIKSQFTWDVCNGIKPNPKGVKTDIQRKKIDWTSKNVKSVEIIILEAKQALDLFREAIKNKELIKEEIIYKNGKYYKIENLPVL